MKITIFLVGLFTGICFVECTTAQWRTDAVTDIKQLIGRTAAWAVGGVRQGARWVGEKVNLDHGISEEIDPRPSTTDRN